MMWCIEVTVTRKEMCSWCNALTWRRRGWVQSMMVPSPVGLPSVAWMSRGLAWVPADRLYLGRFRFPWVVAGYGAGDQDIWRDRSENQESVSRLSMSSQWGFQDSDSDEMPLWGQVHSTCYLQQECGIPVHTRTLSNFSLISFPSGEWSKTCWDSSMIQS